MRNCAKIGEVFEIFVSVLFIDLKIITMKDFCIGLTIICAMFGAFPALEIKMSSESDNTCGVPKIHFGMIVHGQNFRRGSFPWTVALMHTATKPAKFFCAGTLISETFVISGEI